MVMDWLFSCYGRGWKRSSISHFLAASNRHPPTIPEEIIFVILSELPVKFLCQLKSVSKTWLAIINEIIRSRPEKKLHNLIMVSENYPYSFYTLNLQNPYKLVEIKNFSKRCLKIVGSFNGVLLLSPVYAYNEALFLWNLSTRKHRFIQQPCNYVDSVLKGLAYDSAKDDFKVVMVIRERLHNIYYAQGYVFSSSSSSWKKIGNVKYHYSRGRGVVVNGCPHWIVGRLGCPDVILYFHPGRERFAELHVPFISTDLKLTVLGGYLSVLVNKGLDGFVDVWIFKGFVWSKFFAMPPVNGGLCTCVYTPLCLGREVEDLDDESVVFQRDTHALALYNPRRKRYETSIELPLDCNKFSAACFVETRAAY